MTAPNRAKETSSRSVLVYVYMLVAATIVIMAAIGGLLVYQSTQLYEMEQQARGFHLNTLLHILIVAGCIPILILLVLASRSIKRREEAEKRLARRALEAELLYKATAIVDRTNSFEDALQQCIDIVCEMIDWPVGHVYLPSPDGAKRLDPSEIWHLADQQRFAKFREVTEQTSFALGDGLPGRIWKSGEPEWIVNVQAEDDFSRNNLCDDLGVKAGFGFPVRVKGETLAILEFFAVHKEEKNDTLLLLVRSVGEQVGRLTERKVAEETVLRQHQVVADELEKAKRKLIAQTHLATLGQVSAQIAHEMRNPLGAVGNAVYYLRRHLPETERKWLEYLNLIDSEVSACNRIISDLLDVTRVRSIAREKITLKTVVGRVLSRFSIPNEVEIRIDLHPDPFELFADKDQMVQLMDNLLQNSLDAVGKKDGKIVIHARRNGRSDIISLKDNGGGIPAEHGEFIFEALYTTKPAGTGLGLPICKQIVEGHGGTIALAEASPRGTKFLIRLPRVYPT